jgi:3-phenylpropionate/cinnamic acid dioxygenase small subunit
MQTTTTRAQLQHEVEQFLYREARLIDDLDLHAWLDLMTDDIRYWVPVRETLQNDPQGVAGDDEIAVAHMDEDKNAMTLRVKRLDTGVAHAETPPSRTRHLITNVEVLEEDGDEVTVQSCFHIFQSRREKTNFDWYGKRIDRLRRVDGEWKLARRKVVLDHTILPRAVSIFF